jgi:hypothetical protein
MRTQWKQRHVGCPQACNDNAIPHQLNDYTEPHPRRAHTRKHRSSLLYRSRHNPAQALFCLVTTTFVLDAGGDESLELTWKMVLLSSVVVA